MDTSFAFQRRYVITGAPASGKTTLIGELERRGHLVVHEAAREIIDEKVQKGISVSELRRNDSEFQKAILLRSLQRESTLPTDRDVFLDRGVPDSIAYYTLCGLDASSIREEASGRYMRVFFLERLATFERDYSRVEDGKTVARLDLLLYDSYTNLGYDVIRVPAMSVEERLQFILLRL